MAIVTTPSQGWSSFFSVVKTSTNPTADAPATAVDSGHRHAIDQVGGLTAETFRSWTPTTQEMYLRVQNPNDALKLKETPKEGETAVTYEFKLDANGVVVTHAKGTGDANWTPAPSGGKALVADPASLTAATFQSWTDKSQKAYLATVSGGASASVNLPTGQDNTYEHFFLKTDAANRTSVWTSGLYAAEGLQNTPGMKEKIPYHYLPGSASGSGDVLSKASDALFPELDGLTNKLPEAERPAKFGTDPTTIAATPVQPSDPNDAVQKKAFEDALAAANRKWAEFIADFNTWHSAYQIEYVDKYGKVPSGGTQKVLEIPVSVLDRNNGAKFAVPPLMTAMISSEEPRKLYRLESIGKQDVALMSTDDQNTVARTPVFAVTVQKTLGLSTDKTATIKSLKALEDRLATLFDDPAANGSTKARAVFQEELNLLRQQIDRGTLYSKAQIDDTVEAIRTRVDRLAAFYDAKATAQGTATYAMKKITGQNDKGEDVWTTTSYAVPTNVISLDDGKSVSNAFTTMLAQEARILETARVRANLAGSGSTEVTVDGRGVGIVTSGTGKRIDAPTLIYLLQDKYNQELEAEVAIETEYVKQVNELLKTYAVMQDSVNRTLGSFQKIEDNGNPNTARLEQSWMPDIYDGNASDREENLKRVIQMFDQNTATVEHPVEKLQNVPRPTLDLTNNNNDFYSFTHQQWTTFGTRLSDAVTQLNQESQMRMNEINNKDKERNRHYELANSSLSKMNDALQGILRAMA